MLGLKRAVLLASLAIVISAAVALAQEFPTKPIELVIPWIKENLGALLA